MIVTCPACDAQYALPDEAIGDNGRRVKCSSCGYSWLQMPMLDDEEAGAGPEQETSEFSTILQSADEKAPPAPRMRSEPTPTPVEPQASLGRVIMASLAWAVIMLALLFGGLVIWRGQAVAAWPPLALLFETVHMPVEAPGKGVAIKELSAKVEPGAKGSMLNLKGQLLNTVKEPVALPRLKVRLIGENERWLKDWDIDLHGQSLPAGEKADFTYQLQDAPTGAQRVSVQFQD